MRTIGTQQYGIAVTALALLVVTTRDTIWKYFAVLGVLMTAWYVYSLYRKRKGG